MKREHVISTAITNESYKKLRKIIANRMLNDEDASMSIILRDAVDLYLTNGNCAPAQDNKPVAEPDDKPVAKPEGEPTPEANSLPDNPVTNPFSDLNF